MKIDPSPVYLDTSALVKLYLPEPHSDDLEAAILGRRDLFVSDLALTELCSALARRVRDVSDGSFRCAELSPRVHRDAERLLLTVGRSVPLRAADSLHMALALSVDARALVTFDLVLATAASHVGSIGVYGV